MSSDLATLFTGRTFEIKVYPFSYKEYLEYYNKENDEKVFDSYVFEGGLSGSYLYKENDEKYNYVKYRVILEMILKIRRLKEKLIHY